MRPATYKESLELTTGKSDNRFGINPEKGATEIEPKPALASRMVV